MNHYMMCLAGIIGVVAIVVIAALNPVGATATMALILFVVGYIDHGL